MISVYFFDDEYLERKVFSRSKRSAVCDITGEQTDCIDEDLLIPYFNNLLSIYRPYHPMEAAAIYPGGSPQDDGVMIWEAIQNDFGIFNWQYEADLENFFRAMFPVDHRDGGYNSYLENPVCRIDHEIGEDQAHFEMDLWESFKEELKHKNRFFINSVIDLKSLKTIFGFRKRYIKVDTRYFRVRPGHGHETNQMGKPPNQVVLSPGRANPPGISYLYLGSNEQLCQIEARVQEGNQYSVGQFRVSRRLKIVDLTWLS